MKERLIKISEDISEAGKVKSNAIGSEEGKVNNDNNSLDDFLSSMEQNKPASASHVISTSSLKRI